jgi:hypothetical protein
MDSEIRAIMAQYMPLDSQTEVNNHMQEEIWFWVGSTRWTYCQHWDDSRVVVLEIHEVDHTFSGQCREEIAILLAKPYGS